MLSLLRKKNVMKKILWALVLLIVPAFVLWGAGSAMRSREEGPKYVGLIFGKKVSFAEFAKSANASRNEVLLSFYGQPEALREIAEKINLNMMGWQRLIMLKEADKRHITVSNQELTRYIKSIPLFSREGRFDPRAYEYIIKYSIGATTRDFEEQTRDGLKLEKLKHMVTKNISVSDEEIEREYKKQNESVKLNYILIKPEEFKDKIDYTEEELKDYYSKNVESFKRPPQLNAEYIKIEPADEPNVNKIQADLAQNKSLDDIAKENNLVLNETGLFYVDKEIPGIGLSYEAIKAIADLNKGQTSSVVKTQRGEYYIFRLKDDLPFYTPTFDEAREAVTDAVKMQKSSGLAKIEAENIRDQIEKGMASGSAFQDICAALGRTPITTQEPLKRTDYIPEIGPSAEFTDEAFKLEPNNISGIIETVKGLAIVQLSERIAINPESFDKDKEEFRKKVLDSKRSEALDKWFSELASDTKVLVDLSSGQ